MSVFEGDALDWLRTIDPRSVDAVVTDPPYGINTKSDGMGKINPWADLCNASLWYSTWIGECRRVLKSTGCLWSFLNWRSLPTFMKASCGLGWPIESLLVWDKCWIGPGGSKGLRPSYELLALWCMPSFAIKDRGIPDVVRSKWSGTKPTGHPAEKPLDLVLWIMGISGVGSGSLVVDPFCGSGTSGVAAISLGAEFHGCEIDQAWRAYALQRIGETPAGSNQADRQEALW